MMEDLAKFAEPHLIENQNYFLTKVMKVVLNDTRGLNLVFKSMSDVKYKFRRNFATGISCPNSTSEIFQ